MKDTDTFNNHAEKIIEQNALFFILDSKVIFKNGRKRVTIYSNQITNVRLVKNRNCTINILILAVLTLFYLKTRVFFDFSILFHFLFLGVILILGIVACYIKKHSYVMLINKGRFGYDEIFISRKNVSVANCFISKFQSKSVEQVFKSKTSLVYSRV
jgi:hypothetical protein